ncbi:MAG: phosphosulfolactate synthase [Bacteroidetes bacterium]|nr:MAG: phosphosulfolactate synthase [Bacteroidota bacterium]
MNYSLTQVPERSSKPRQTGFTMIMDKGLSIREVEDFLSVAAEYSDVVKLGWATSAVTPNLRAKLDVYRNHNIPFYFGGTLLEAFYVRGQLDTYRDILKEYDVKWLEVSSGSVDIPILEKCKIIESLAKDYTVLSEVGSKSSSKIMAPYEWVSLMRQELNAGSWKVIAEAREGGNVGAFNEDGGVRTDLIEEILRDVPSDKIVWEAPQKSQQVWFIKTLGSDVNLGNIAPAEAIPLETLRLGLRGDTFFDFLDKA